MIKPDEVKTNRFYKASRSNDKGSFYITFDENKNMTIYLSNEKNEIFSVGNKEPESDFFERFIIDCGPLRLCSIDEEAKIRLLINIFHGEEEHD